MPPVGVVGARPSGGGDAGAARGEGGDRCKAMEFWRRFERGPVPAPPSTDRIPVVVTTAVGWSCRYATTAARRLAGWMADAARPLGPEMAGLPTLGHAFGPLVAGNLGHPSRMAPGHSRKRRHDAARQ